MTTNGPSSHSPRSGPSAPNASVWVLHRDTATARSLARRAGVPGAHCASPAAASREGPEAPRAVVLGVADDFEAELEFAFQLSESEPELAWLVVAETADLGEAERLFDALPGSIHSADDPEALAGALADALARRASPPLSERRRRARATARFTRWSADLVLPELFAATDPRRVRVPVLLSGEPGTGKAMLARYLHQLATGIPAGPLWALDCDEAEGDALLASWVLESGSRRSAQLATFCLDDADALPRRAQREVARWIELGMPSELARRTAPSDPLMLGNAGTAMRFLTAACTLAEGPSVLDGSPRMRERPIDDLVAGLAGLGADVATLEPTGCPPLRTGGGGLPGGSVELDASLSSQYVSAILLAAPFAERDVELRFRHGTLVSRPYVDVTLQVMAAFGAAAHWLPEGAGVHVRAGRRYAARHYAIEPDASSAVYPLCAAAIRGGRARVVGIPPDSRQSDLALLPILERMGCSVVRGDAFVELIAPEDGLASLGSVDMNDLPDAVMAYAVVALFARGPTRIENIGNLRIKETDRLQALETELGRLGARVRTGEDWIEIRPGPLQGARIETYDDHRMAMAFALAGMRIPGVEIRDPGCVSKSWPDYFESFEQW